MIRLGEFLDPFRKQIIDIKDALARARYRYDGLDLVLENILEAKFVEHRRRYFRPQARR